MQKFLEKMTVEERKYYYHEQYLKHRKKQLEYKENKEHSKNDTNYLIKRRLRKIIYDTVKKGHKSKTTIQLLGCSIDELKIHLQKTAINNGYNYFNIEKYSGKEYHIDHILPCSLFNLEDEDEQRRCFYWTDLQILKSDENLSKSSKII